ncbi:Leucine rich repeat-containing protein [Peptoniphilus asaccharolyticus DSM 20463]|uniref:Leucine rich repeat-containing protein n=1 Tax=Peptoniphilus asaccharolyticus DSM 20463 TaxID=573058 RepID=A0A1W1VKM4_PEPAS|nr:leucine-rich repeat domain-containing protein [Peptoniphilus asaccharolyticus]MBL7574465.1 leucine-rich repeat domain-containing protein [Peptoniphilus asaccharolyticus]SMB93856.1 Leucine rich repeat-containing protein [Peptoniphilus asaccharolyticus DSM 20463]
MDNQFEFDDFIIKGDTLVGMTRQGKDKIKNEGITHMPIPKEGPDGTPIRKIGQNCFYRRKLSTFEIPETVEEIGYDAFGVNNISEITIPDSVKKIDGFAFYRNKLTNIKLPAELTHIGPSAFALNNISNIEFNDKLELIDTSSFYSNAIEKLELPSSLKKINMFAFRKNNIFEVEVPANVAELHKDAFETTTIINK